jgi:hypothetical protein
MIHFKQESRPTCDKILEEKNNWALSLNELNGIEKFEISEKVEKIEDNKCLFFIKIKSNNTISI